MGLRPVAAALLAASLLSAVSVRAQDDGDLVDGELIFPAPRPTCPCVGPTRGSLLIAGGGQLPPDIYRTFVRLAGNRDARIVVIPTASEGDDPHTGDTEAFLAAGAGSVEVLHTRDRVIADSEPFTAPLRNATAVWLSGGRQWRLVEAYLGTQVHRELLDVLARGGVVGGTSAGASALASYLVRGTPDGSTRVAEPGYDTGFSLLRGVAVEQHLQARDREDDLQRIVELYPQLLGIGLDEGTALVIKGDLAWVEGVGQVAIYDRRGWRVPVTFRFLDRGDSYDLGQWRWIRGGLEDVEGSGS